MTTATLGGFLNTRAGGYVALALVGGVALYVIYRNTKGAVVDAAKAVGTAVNPVSDKNLAYRATNAVGEAITGDQSFSLGSWFYDFTHEAYDPNKPITRAAEKRSYATSLLNLLRGGSDPVTLREQSNGN